MKAKKLVYGVGINDADYVVQKNETIMVNGGAKAEACLGVPLPPSMEVYAYALLLF